MANTATKGRNDKRNNGKAWGKNHAPAVKVMTPEQQVNKVQKDARRAQHSPVSRDVRGFGYTMPKITWELATEYCVTSGRKTQTRRLRMIELVRQMEASR